MVAAVETDIRHFNPRSREGSDGVTQTGIDSGLKFQSTLPRRERLMSQAEAGFYTKISIHAPAKGATVFHLSGERGVNISIHAPAKGAT